MTETPSRPLRVICKDCETEWTAAQLPMTIDELVAACNGIKCPKCGGGQIFMVASKR